MEIISRSMEIAGRTLTLEVGRFARKANSAVLGKYGETMILAAVVEASPREDLDYFPLTVDYIERLYAGGRIKGSRWVKREGRTSDEGILIGRLIDRSLRPLFPNDGYFNEVQVTVTLLSVDLENDPDVLSVITSSAALAAAGLPWEGPIGSVRIGLKEGVPFINPTREEREFSDLDLVVSSTQDRVVMIEAGAKEVPEDLISKAIAFGIEENRKIIGFVRQLQIDVGTETRKLEIKSNMELKSEVKKLMGNQLADLAKESCLTRGGEEKAKALLEEIILSLGEEKKKEIVKLFWEIIKEEVRATILKGRRPDGRRMDEVREVECEVGILPRTHGSAMFRRGETQVLSVTTLGAPSLEQLIESAEGEETKRYIHHYSMPPYSHGETGRISGPNRREIGHGALAERALEAVIPPEDKFPYTIRIVSEVLSSNGSTSMASCCGSTLSLMDAGVPITAPVSGVAMGLISQGSHDEVLTDIAGYEDFFGDMDFKVAGTKKGVTAIQMDVKTFGLSEKIIGEILAKAKVGRGLILDKMLAVIPSCREKISKYAPRVSLLRISPEKIGEVIGPGGRMIRKIMEATGAEINIEDDGTVSVSGVDDQSVAAAISQIDGLTRDIKAGDEFLGEVKRIQPFGAFVEVLPGREGLVHVSQMSTRFVSDPSQLVSIGQKVKVRVTEIDEQHRINLSMLSPEEGKRPRSSLRSKEFKTKGFSRSLQGGNPRFSRFSLDRENRFRR
jgi:polyribonucleotide nucleotidyltransferase